MRSSCVYMHKKKSNNEVFYIGKGLRRRVSDASNRNKHWHNIVNKHGFTAVVIEDGLTDEEAIELEVLCISEIGRKDIGTGPLVNMTIGGDGVLGAVVTKETRDKISKAGKGRVMSEDTRRKLSEARKGIKFSSAHKKALKKAVARRKESGNYVSKETRDKISKARKGVSFSDSHVKNIKAASIEINSLRKKAAEFFGKGYRKTTRLDIDRYKQIFDLSKGVEK